MKHIHFLGIGGSGASAAAAIAQAQGFAVTGCDLEPHNEFTAVFQKNQLFKDHSPEHLYRHPKTSLSLRPRLWRGKQSPMAVEDPSLIAAHDNLIDILAVTPAIYSLDPNNPELLEAKKKGIPVVTWQEFLGKYLAKDKFVIAVAGTHGKSTTTAMIGLLLEEANLDPTVELGAVVPKWHKNFRLSNQSTNDRGYFVLEADEFNDNFLHLKPDIAVVTNIEMDHPEYFKDFEAVKESFKKFLLQTKKAVVNLSDPGTVETLLKLNDRQHLVKSLDFSKIVLGFSLKIPGEFNKLNAKAALQAGLILGIDPQIIQKSLSGFTGAGRRFEYIGGFNGAKVYSDFGHHPTEIKVTVEAAREKFPHQRILLIYQPHMFSRTKALFYDFVKVFQNMPVDKIFMMDIYPSREIDTGLVTSQQLIKAVQAAPKEMEPKLRNGVKMVPEILYVGNTNQVLKKLKPEIKKGDIVFFMSAGDTDKLAKELVNST